MGRGKRERERRTIYVRRRAITMRACESRAMRIHLPSALLFLSGVLVSCSSSGGDLPAPFDSSASDSTYDVASSDSGPHDTLSDSHADAPHDASTVDASKDVTDATDTSDACPTTTRGGVTLPSGWCLVASDRFGTGAGANVKSNADLHEKYYEAQAYNRDASGLVRIPNVVINHEQETYAHFEDVIVFAGDHLTIQARGHADGSITSGEMVSKAAHRSFCVEAKYTIPNVDKSWPAFWFYGDADGHDASEIDVEQPVYAAGPSGGSQSVHQVSLYNHPTQGTLTIVDSKFDATWMTWTNPSFDGSSAPHVYTACYEDDSSSLRRYIDGAEIYSSVWKWNESLGGTGKGPDASVIVNLAVGGDWPGNVATPSAFSADFDVYAIDTYGP